MAIGLLVRVFTPKQYKAKVEFFLKNPLYGDRSYLYSNDARMIDYMAGDEDIDRLKSIVWADSVQDRIIREMHLVEAFHVDTGKRGELKKLKKNFSSRVNIYRSESKVIILTYTDKDEDRASAIAVRCVQLLEANLHGFYNEMRQSIYATLSSKIHSQDSAINTLTDSLAALRDKYGIYDIISPARYNIMLSSIKNNGNKGFGRGIEEVQNVEAMKDQLVSDRARNTTLAGQYTTGTMLDELPLTRILKSEKPPLEAEGPSKLSVLFACGLLGFFFGVLYVLAYSYTRTRSLSTLDAKPVFA
jgi:uncharacterized protein involved in exopolysaccharide biosynthesis